VVVVVREAAVRSSPRWCWSSWSRCGGRARGRGAQLAAVVADLVVAELAVVVVVREAAVVVDLTLGTGVPSSPRWRCWSPIAAVQEHDTRR
jgi:hypothetical protein